MNDALASIFKRRSVRKYTDKAIPESMITDMLEAAMAAPSAVAKDPWRFIVVQERGTLDKIAEGLPHGQMLREAPLAFVVCGDIEVAHDGKLSYMLQDCSAAIENLLLAASMLGLGGVWLGVHPREERIAHMRALFALPDNILPISVLSIGWPAAEPAARTRYDAAYVHRERWEAGA